ncbi:MFS general substrate transporter [Glarea lozoyensis ATCC 20868]|uniref:MFS general substrate transporter n=1 Tax=Glarea lozoyensis (strain ATCC 20868 / MF5171) TaxID=1116229 RepID=S3CKV5_GLAL2|nr:MFS general substrate transporter [Glarea lozoyensis ATCC 20868]EPE26385.1 MFS general substrate transporter [Glarea lozoyensis ATCC 20868]
MSSAADTTPGAELHYILTTSLPVHDAEKPLELPVIDNRFLVGWEDDRDLKNPRNFHTIRKWLCVTVVSMGSLLVTCTSSLYTSCYGQLHEEFGNSQEVATLGLSLFVVGLAVGPMMASPLSEFYGRKWIYLMSMFLFLLFLVPCAVAQNIQTMLVGRFLDGLAGSAFLSVAAGTVADLFVPSEIQNPMTVYTVAAFIGPAVGPVIGGFINSFASWRWSFYVLMIWTGILLLCLIFTPETHEPTLLYRKALATRLSFVGIGLGTVLATCTNPIWRKNYDRLVRNLEADAKRNGEEKVPKPEPEFRLPPAIFGAVAVTVSMFWFGWTTYRSIHWIVPMIATVLFGGGHVHSFRSFMNRANLCSIFLVFSSIWTFLVAAYPAYAASALAANTFARCMFAAAFPLFGEQMYKRLDDQWATSLLAFITLAMMPLP